MFVLAGAEDDCMSKKTKMKVLYAAVSTFGLWNLICAKNIPEKTLHNTNLEGVPVSNKSLSKELPTAESTA
jgi:hypothetical protein